MWGNRHCGFTAWPAFTSGPERATTLAHAVLLDFDVRPMLGNIARRWPEPLDYVAVDAENRMGVSAFEPPRWRIERRDGINEILQ